MHWHRSGYRQQYLKADEASYEWKLGPDFLALFDEEHEGITGHFRSSLWNFYREGGFDNA